MKGILALCAIAAAVVGVAVAQAGVVVNETQAVPISVFVPCANGGAGETISGTLDIHVLISLTINGNNVSGKVQSGPQGGSLVGETTGDTYRATGVSKDIFKASLQNGQLAVSFVNNFRMIGPGPGNNYLEHQNTHITINANGDVTVTHDNFSVDCK